MQRQHVDNTLCASGQMILSSHEHPAGNWMAHDLNTCLRVLGITYWEMMPGNI